MRPVWRKLFLSSQLWQSGSNETKDSGSQESSGSETIWEISDYSDMELIKPAKSSHNIAQVRLAKRLRSEGCDGYLVGASGCALCSPCRKALGQPCSFPDYQFSCMSAYCIFVKKLTDKCGIEYDCGEGLLAFFGMYVFD